MAALIVTSALFAACGGGGEEGPAATAGTPSTPAAVSTAPPTGGPSVGVEPSTVSAGETFTISIGGLPEDIVSGAREVCVGVLDPAGARDTVKLGRVPPGEAEREMKAVLPPGTDPGAYEVAVAPCDFAPGSTIASAELTVR